jgi:hypothetical protein
MRYRPTCQPAPDAGRRLYVCISFEPMRKVGLKVWLVALRIGRRLAALRRGNHDLGASVLERVVGRGELLEALTPVFEQGTFKAPKIDRVIPLSEGTTDYEQIARGEARDRLVLAP